MHRDHVDSEAVASIGYDAERAVLEVEYAGGAVYRYFDVPREVYDAFMEADSKGRFVQYVIKPAFAYEARD